MTFAAAAAAALLVACNGGGGDPGTLSKSDFASKANALCTKAEAERTRLLQQLPAQPGQANAQTVDDLARGDRELIRRVDALVPPDAEQDRVDRVLDGWRQRAELEEQYANALRSTPAPQSLDAFTAQVDEINATVAPTANRLQMTECTRSAS